MDGYLAKPVNREFLTRMIQSVLGAATAVQPRHTHSEARSDGSSLRMEELINIGGPRWHGRRSLSSPHIPESS
jgi:hypothetical protein